MRNGIYKAQKPVNENGVWLFYMQGQLFCVQRMPTPKEERLMGKDFKCHIEYEKGRPKCRVQQSW